MAKPRRVVDLHVHSHFSRATSRDMDLSGLYRWGKLKGIHLIGTGDFTHPQWLHQLEEQLVADESGVYNLNNDISSLIDAQLPEQFSTNPLAFIPTVEISCIYKRGEKTRKVHNLIVMPDFNSVRKLNSKLVQYGKLAVDGRPTVMLDSRELLELTFEINPDALFIPAHVWTPWFGVMGSKSGFDSLAEAFGESLPLISAVETGLSSDPAMNRQLNELDRFSLVSFSDAHSPRKLGREATVLATDLTYYSITNAVTTGKGLVGTYEFFPEEGKYFADGHVKCGVCMSFEESTQHNLLCPVCNRPMTIGVNHRISVLAQGNKTNNRNQKKTWHLVPLEDILAQVVGVKSTTAKQVQRLYMQLVLSIAPEFELLLHTPIEIIANLAGTKVASAISLVRHGELEITPGYDGLYGKIKIPSLDKYEDKLPLFTA